MNIQRFANDFAAGGTLCSKFLKESSVRIILPHSANNTDSFEKAKLSPIANKKRGGKQ